MTTDSFLTWFESTFGSPSPLAVDLELVKAPDAVYWGTEIRPELSPSAMMIPAFVEAIDPYIVTGCWGHGIASHAFYWIERRTSRRAFFRLSFGGAYGDRREEAAEVVRFLEGYRDFMSEFSGRLVRSTLVHSMGVARFELALREADGSLRELADDGATIPYQPNGAPLPAREWWQWLRARAGGTAASSKPHQEMP